ncbi:MAG: hypothetical protein ACR2HM_02020 [Acidimicrobiales bacterium]
MSGLPRRRVLTLLGGAAAASAIAGPARATPALDLDLQILQTASSLEALAEAAWARVPADALAGCGAGAGPRHTGLKEAFQARTVALGGRPQGAPNPKFAPLLAGADPAAALATIETVLVDTYLANLTELEDPPARELVAGAMATCAQHLAFLRVVGAMVAGGRPELVRIPFLQSDLALVPAASGTVAPPEGLHRAGPEGVAEPATGAPG